MKKETILTHYRVDNDSKHLGTTRGQQSKPVLMLPGRVGGTVAADGSQDAELGRHLIALYSCSAQAQTVAGDTALLASRYRRVLDLIVAGAQRRAFLQQQLKVSPYTPSVMSVIENSQGCEEVFALLGYIVRAYCMGPGVRK
jgi:hypothetical protein